MQKRILKEQRTESILWSLKRFDYLTQAQIQVIHDLKGERNANRVLNGMSAYISSFRNGLEKVYYLNKNGREYMDHNIIRKKTANADHFITRNQLWIYLRRPKEWQNEIQIKAGDISLVCDAKTSQNGIPVFIEVDISQPMQVNKAKIQKYKKLQQISKDPFYVVWVTKFPGRKKKLMELSTGLKGHVYTVEEII
ncbi:replication-relaxation family protein [Bacillus sp. mrc49]|uniref:replication-relaxation family protein n=1 Tax=Bacillus sp. mrc49 TaxID=2054913 RepID=UPI0012FD6303|nr:replication-relaxation family protein [Bacillus sp. mrc49]